MLIFTRNANEKIRITNEISIEVSSVKSNRIKLTIDAPDHVKITRGEVLERDRIKAEEEK